MGHEFIENSAHINLHRSEISLYGFTSIPTFNRASAEDQFLFVNNRPVKDKLLQISLRTAYQDYLARDRHPITVLFLQIDPQLVDVNVHPAKTEVRFHDPNTLRGLLISAIKDALSTKSHMVSTTIANTTLGLFRNKVIDNHLEPNKYKVTTFNKVSDNSSNYQAQKLTPASQTKIIDDNIRQQLIKTIPYAKVEVPEKDIVFVIFPWSAN